MCVIFSISISFIYGQNTVIINQYDNSGKSNPVTRTEVCCVAGDYLWNNCYVVKNYWWSNSDKYYDIYDANGKIIIEKAKDIYLLPNGQYKAKNYWWSNSDNYYDIYNANGKIIMEKVKE